MRRGAAADWQAALALSLALAFWYLTFVLKPLNFWLSMSLAVTTLTGFAFACGGVKIRRAEWTRRNFLLGAAAAAILYGIFWAGNAVSAMLFSFAPPEITAIYGIRQEGSALPIALVLLFVTSPGEEIFWRGFIQSWAGRRFGPAAGWVLAAGLYAAVHIVAGNFMLIMAALVAGLFWGFLYWRSASLVPCIISHSLWTVAIFILWPVA